MIYRDNASEMRVGFIGARWLGVRCLELLSDVVAVSVTPREQSVWWTDLVDEDEVTRLGYENVEPNDVFDAEPDLVYSVLASHIFTPGQIESTPMGIINLHPAPLPEYRGCNSCAHAIVNGDSEYRVTAHYVEPTIDSGPIVGQRSLPIYPYDTGHSLYARAQMEALTLFSWLVAQPVLTGTPQDESRANYYPRNSIEGIKQMQTPEAVRALTFPGFAPHPLADQHLQPSRS